MGSLSVFGGVAFSNTKAMASKKPAAAVKKLSEKEAEQAVLEYMRTQNRPYNNKTVFENLHGAVGQAQVTKILADLATKGVLTCKENKKQKIYWITQQAAAPSNQAEPENFEKEISDLSAEMQALKEQLETAHNTNKQLTSQPSDEDAAKMITTLLSEEKWHLLSQNTQLVNPEEKAAIEKKFAEARDAWRKRKRIVVRTLKNLLLSQCRDIVDSMCSSSGQTPKELGEMVGLETDEDAHVSLEAGESVRQFKKQKR